VKPIILGAAMFLLAGLAVGQTPAAKPQPEPTLKETLDSIQESLKSNGNVEEDSNRATIFYSVRLAGFDGCQVHFVWTTAHQPNKPFYRQEDSFNLADIDPANARFQSLGSSRQGTFTAVTQNLIKRITYKAITYPIDGSVAQQGLEFGGNSAKFAAELDKSYGDYFANAFRQAVELCGGRSSVVTNTEAHDLDEPALQRTSKAVGSPVPPRMEIPEIVKASQGTVVSIVIGDEDQPLAQGTGFFVRKDGIVITNFHVIANGDRAIVKLPDGKTFPVEGVLAFDKRRDLAVIKVRGSDFKAVILGDSNQVRVGEDVVAIGNPLSLESTVSNGIVSGIRSIPEEGGRFLQVTAPISPGSSGGPLFDMRGRVIGITSMFLQGGENLNFAIPINDAKRLLQKQSAQLHPLPDEPGTNENPKVSDEANGSQSQETCEARAEKFALYERQSYPNVPLKNGYVAEYDSKTNRCYTETAIDFGPGTDATIEGMHVRYSGEFYEIKDAFIDGDGSPSYGEFFFHQEGIEVPGGECRIYPQGSQSSQNIGCRSEEEFNDLATKYFGIPHPAKPTTPSNSPTW
jgi:S1-C subfamily serine protease